MCKRLSLQASDQSHLQLNELAIFHLRKNNYHRFFRVPRGVTRWGDGARLMAVAAPLTPRPRGTIYEALPFYP